MIEIENWAVPFVGYKCMTVWPFLFVRDDLMVPMRLVDYRHENIHGRQQMEVLSVGIFLAAVLFFLGCGWWSLLGLPLFFWWYVVEWFVKLIITGFSNRKAYRSISFEQEAFAFEDDSLYMKRRKPFAWIKYIFKLT